MKPTLLIIDDVPEILKAHERSFKYDFEVLLASTLETAKQLARTKKIDAILTDWHIGPETPESLLHDYPMPTVILTGTPDSVLAPGVMVLAKPAAVDDIMAALRGEMAKAQ